MLKSSGDGRGFVAKVADFGLSVKMGLMETHMSNVFQGTMTHMAPEILMEGRVSKAADVSGMKGMEERVWDKASPIITPLPLQGNPPFYLSHHSRLPHLVISSFRSRLRSAASLALNPLVPITSATS
jgi:serine/threonine protein kinase